MAWEEKSTKPEHFWNNKLYHLVVGLEEDLVVLGQGDQEDDGGHILKAVDPLPPLGPLTAHVHHSAITYVKPLNCFIGYSALQFCSILDCNIVRSRLLYCPL